MRTRVLVPLVIVGLASAAVGIVVAQPMDVGDASGPGVVYSGSYTPVSVGTVARLVVDDPWREPVGDGLLALGAGTVGATAAAAVLTRRPGRG